MSIPAEVKIVEVGPRDGLQNESNIVDTDVKVDFINRLSETGLTVIEATSFVSPKWIPQLADHQNLFSQIRKYPNVCYPVLIPNIQGLENALSVGVTDIAVFTTPSESFSKKNTNASVEESIEKISHIMVKAKQNNVRVRGYLSCVLGCPYEGDISASAVLSISKKLLALGCEEISLGDTIGVGNPKSVKQLINLLAKEIPLRQLAVHFHDTYGQALTNIYVALEQGIRIVDSSVAGLGGCPYAKGAAGNVATEDVIYMLQGLNVKTNVDLDKLIGVAEFICEALSITTQSKVGLAYKKTFS